MEELGCVTAFVVYAPQETRFLCLKLFLKFPEEMCRPSGTLPLLTPSA